MKASTKSARKHWCGLTTVTQDPADLLGTDLGRAVVANSATQVLLGQAPQAIDSVAAEFGLSGGERVHLLTARPGEGLLAGAGTRVTFTAVASESEHQLVTTDPAFLAAPVPGTRNPLASREVEAFSPSPATAPIAAEPAVPTDDEGSGHATRRPPARRIQR